MTAYFLKLVILLPLVAGMAFGSLYLWRKVQPGLALGRAPRHVKIVDAIPLGPAAKLAVVEFGGSRLLLAVARGTVALVSEQAIASSSPAGGLGDRD
jgi:flagellar protein FliO/FliZ